MNTPRNVRSLARLIALGLIVSAAGVAAQTEGDKTPNSRKPVVGIVNPGSSVVSLPVRVQVRVFSPLAADNSTTQPLTSVTLAYSGPTAGTIPLTQNPNYTGTNPQSGLWEGKLTALTTDATYTLVASAANGSGTVQSGAVYITVSAGRGDGNLLVRDNAAQLCSDCHAHQTHSSEATGPEHYGSWYTGCRTCHQPHDTTNASLVAMTVQPPDVNVALPPAQVVFSNRRGFYAAGGASNASNATYANGDNTGICQVCHTQTQFYRQDGNDYPAPTFAAVPSGSHYPVYSGGCGSCHTHKNGMKASCSSCHGAAGGRASAISGVTDAALAAAPPITPTTSAPIVASGGRHASHTNKDSLRTNAFLCADCHLNSSHNGAVSFGWSTAATGTGAKLVTVYPAGNTTTTWVNNPSCTNYCHGASLADSFGASTRIAVKWNTAATLTCGSCHGAPPSTGSHNSTMTECTPCHENGYSPTAITTSAAKLLHIDGKVDASGCNGCHGDPARQPLPGSDSAVQNAPPKRSGGNILTDVIGDRGVGVHQAHVNVDTTLATTIANPISCGECHAVVDSPTHPLNHPENGGEANVDFGTIANKGGGRAFTYPSCNVYCHAPTGTSSLSFYTAATLDCASCHGNAASLSTGSHALHVADAGTYKGTTYNCLTCHPDVASTNATITDKAAHVDGTNTVAALTSWSEAGKTCASNACHSDGRETPTFVTATWGSGGAGGSCTECHGREAGGIAGAPWYGNVYPGVQTANSHGKHVKAATDCAKCHPTTVDATGKILAGGGDHLKNGRNVSPGTGLTFTYNESAETCSNISCHGNKNATWGETLGCTSCHGDLAKPQTATVVDPNWQSAPPYDAAGGSTGVKVGAHAKHTNSSTFREAAFACTECHTAASLTSHNQSRDAGWGIIATNNSAVAPTPLAGLGAYDAWTSPYNCTNYCHGATLTGGTNTSPSWTATGMTCTSCHGTTGLTTGSHALHLADASAYKGTTYGCVTCHDTADNTSILIKSQHLDRAVSTADIGFIGGACTSNACHSDGRETANFVTATWGSGAPGGTCTECHGREAGGIAGAPWYGNVYPGVQTANSHDKHVKSATDCAKCHPTTVDAAGKILAGGGDHLKNGRNVSPRAGIAFTYDEGTETCSNISCHGNKSATWGESLGCNDCHGNSGTARTKVTGADPLLDAAPPVGLAGESLTSDRAVGAHLAHANQNTFRTNALVCSECHAGATHDESRALGAGTLASTGGRSITFNGTTCASTYCHAPGGVEMGGSDRTPTWTAGATEVGCGTCHGAVPALSAAMPHPQNTVNPCSDCHGPGYATSGITLGARGYHLNGSSVRGTDEPNNGCTACHGVLAGATAAAVPPTSMTSAPGYVGATTGVDSHGGAAVTGVLVGAHDAHVRPAGSLGSVAAIDCSICHGTKPAVGNTAHADGTIAIGWSAPANSGTFSPTTFASWASPYNCTNYCHSNAAPLNGTDSRPQFSWVSTAGDLNCDSCHKTATFGTTGLSAKHQKHLTGYAYKCDECHATTMANDSSSSIGTPANHVNGAKLPAFSQTMLTTTVNNQGGAYSNSPNYGCTATYCHSDGTTTTPPFTATSNPTAMSWSNGTTSAACDNCHGGNSSATYKLATGSHTGHVNAAANYTGNFGCAMCHSATSATDTTFSTVTNHVNGLKEVSAPSWNGTGKTCASNACHSNGTETPLVVADYKSVTWGTTLANDCKGCHGTEVGSVASAPWYGNDVGSYKTRNSHQAHIAATDTATVCNTCHSATVGATGILTVAAHLDLDGVPEVSGSSIGSYTDASETCNTVSCHGGNSPQWGATLDCSACHMGATGATDAEVDNYVYGTAPMAKLDPEDWINYGHGKASGAYDSGNTAAAFDTAIAVSADDGCKFCHDKNVDHGLTTNPFRLANVGAGTTDVQKVGVCTVCHGGAGYLGKSSAKAIDATHYGTKHAANGKGGELCWDCHDPHGDYKYSATPGVLAYMIDETPVITHTVAEGSNTQWGQNAITAAATPEFNKSFGTNNAAWDWGDYARSTRTGVCQVCHTATLHFKNTTWVTTANGDADHKTTGGRCTTCHGHDQTPTSAFKETGCNGCHGNKGTARTPVAGADAMLDYAPPTAADGTTSATTSDRVGAHQSHVNQLTLRSTALPCSECHGPSLPVHNTMNPATPNVNIGFGPIATTGSVIPSYSGTGCSATYCHGNFKNGNDQITPAIPGAPTALVFSAVADNTLTVGWTGATGAAIYKVERAPDVAGVPGTFAQIGTTTGTSYNDGGLWAGTVYWYRVRAWSSAGDGAYSADATTRTTGGTVGTLTAADFDLIGEDSATSLDGGATNIGTTATAATATTTVDNRNIATLNATYAGTTVRRIRPAAAISSGTYYFVDIFSTPLTAANFVIGAGASVSIDCIMSTVGTATSGNWSVTLYEYKTDGTSTSMGTCNAPYDPRIATTTRQTSTCTLNNVQYFAQVGSRLKLRILQAPTGSWGRTGLLWGSTTGATYGQTWFRASRGTMSPPALPAAPTGTPTISGFSGVGATSMTLAWSTVTNATSYKVERSLNGTSGWVQVGQPTTLSFTDQGLTADTQYYYRVKASSAGGDAAAYSGVQNQRTSAPAAAAVTSWTGTFTPGSSTMTCTSCHGNPPGGTHPNQTGCNTCHPGYSSIAVVKATHINQVVDVVADCTVCHALAMGARDAVVSEFTNTWSHKRSFTGTPKVNRWDCIVCHMEGDTDGGLSATYHMNGKLNFRDPDTGTNIKAATGFSQTVYTDSNNGGAYTFSTTVEAAPVGFSRNLAVAFASDPNWLDLAAIQVNLCLKCHDSNGANAFATGQPLAAFATAHGFTAEKPFGATIAEAGFTGAGITANGMTGGVADVKASFVTTNASYHPILGKQNNSYVNNALMLPPWNALATNKTGGTINTATSWGYLISCWDCHAPNGTLSNAVLTRSNTAHGAATTIRQAVWQNSTTTTNNLCRVCHTVATSGPHGATSAISAISNSNPNSYFGGQCYLCHSSAQAKPGRPIPGQDAHGFDKFAPRLGTDTWWPYGPTNTWRPYAFMRNAGGTGYSWRTSGSGWRPRILPTAEGGAGTANCAGECNGENTSATYTPGGVY